MHAETTGCSQMSTPTLQNTRHYQEWSLMGLSQLCSITCGKYLVNPHVMAIAKQPCPVTTESFVTRHLGITGATRVSPEAHHRGAVVVRDDPLAVLLLKDVGGDRPAQHSQHITAKRHAARHAWAVLLAQIIPNSRHNSANNPQHAICVPLAPCTKTVPTPATPVLLHTSLHIHRFPRMHAPTPTCPGCRLHPPPQCTLQTQQCHSPRPSRPQP